MMKRHLGAEPGSHAGADVPRATVLSRPLSGCQLPSWPCRGERDCWSPSGLRTGQLEQTKSCCTNSIFLDFLASERKNSARWCPARAADLHNNPLSTTPPDASSSGDLKGSWHPEGGQALLPSSPAFVWAAPPPGTLSQPGPCSLIH